MVAGRIQSLVRGGRNAILDLANLKTEWIPRNLPPDPPTNVVLDSRHIGSNYWNNVSWDPPSDGGPVAGYEIEVRFRSPPPPIASWDWQGVKRTPGILTNDTNPIRGYQYQYRVRTVSPDGESVWVESNQVTIDAISSDTRINSFTVDDSEITSGESTTLRWSSSNAALAIINGTIVFVDGNMSISPTSTTIYTLIVYTLPAEVGPSATQFLTVVVPPVGNDFALSPQGNPRGSWSDGTTMWVSDIHSNKIYAYDMATKDYTPSQDFNTLIAAGNISCLGLWSDGTTMWVSDVEQGAPKIYAYDLATKAYTPDQDFNTLVAAGNPRPYGLWSDGIIMWVFNGESHNEKIYAYDLVTKARVTGDDFDTITADSGQPFGLWSDGTTMWVSDSSLNKIFAYDLATKAYTPDQDFDTLVAAGINGTFGIWSDGITMWVVDNGDDKLYAYDLATKARTP